MILFRIDYLGYCELDIETNEIKRISTGYPPYDNYTNEGRFYEYEGIFFALYKSPNGPMMYYNGNKYPLITELTIKVDINGRERHFSVKEYGIEIDYPEPKYLWDEFSTEEDIDLFVKIANNYKDKSFYELFASKE